MSFAWHRQTPLEVFSVGHTHVQVVLRRLGKGRHTIQIGDLGRDVVARDGLAAVTMEGFDPGSEVWSAVNGGLVAPIKLQDRPAGRRLGRVITISDLHIGDDGAGAIPRFSRRQAPQFEQPVVCANAVVQEINCLSADLVVLKGDLTHRDRPSEYGMLARVLQHCNTPMICMVGNHDGGNHRRCDRVALLERLGIGVQQAPVEQHKAGEAIVTLVETVRPGHHAGTLRPVATRVHEIVRHTPGPMLVLLHHQLMSTKVPYYLPTGIPNDESICFLSGLMHAARVEGRRPVLVSSGHTHRNRVRWHDHIAVTEVGSIKDYPGVYAVYDVYEDAIVQSVRRIAHPSAISLTERSAAAAGTVWAWWAPPRSPRDLVVGPRGGVPS